MVSSNYFYLITTICLHVLYGWVDVFYKASNLVDYLMPKYIRWKYVESWVNQTLNSNLGA